MGPDLGRHALGAKSRVRGGSMRIIRLLLSIVLISAPAVQAQQLKAVPGDSRPADRDAIRAHIDAIFRAYMQKDRTKIEQTHSKEWRGFLGGTDGIVHGLDEYMKNADANLRGQVFSSYKILDFDVMFYGNVALVPYIAQLGPEENHVKLRVLDVYANLPGGWIQVGSYTATHPETQRYYQQNSIELPPNARQELLAAREAVWRDFFVGNDTHLAETVPAEAIAINPGQKNWEGQKEVLAGSKGFAAGGGKLIRLEFPKTEIQTYG